MDGLESHAEELLALPLMHEERFYTSLSQLKTQLEAMNRRTASLLDHHNQRTEVGIISGQAQRQSFLKVPEHLQLPNGPVFWQLFQSLRSDVRDLDARIERVEDRVESLSDRLDQLDRCQFTPSQSSSSTRKEFMASRDVFDESVSSLHTVPQTGQGSRAMYPTETHKLVAAIEDVGCFDPEIAMEAETSMYSHHLRTSDVIVFVAKLKRASRTKQIVNVEQFLRGSALRLYRIGFGIDGTNVFDSEDGHCNVEQLAAALILVFGRHAEASGLMDAKKHTLTDTLEGSRLIQDYAFSMLELGRHLPDCSPEQARRATFLKIQSSLQASYPGVFGVQSLKKVKTLQELLVHLHRLEHDHPRTPTGKHRSTPPVQPPRHNPPNEDEVGHSPIIRLTDRQYSQPIVQQGETSAKLRTAATPALTTYV